MAEPMIRVELTGQEWAMACALLTQGAGRERSQGFPGTCAYYLALVDQIAAQWAEQTAQHDAVTSAHAD